MNHADTGWEMTSGIPADPWAGRDDGHDNGPRLPGFASRRGHALALLVTGAAGWLASGALMLERVALYEDPEYITGCDLNAFVSCGEVFRAWQAALFGFPNPLIGIAAFAVVISTAMALLAGARLARWYWRSLQTGVTLGMGFVVWLWSQALFDIGILCIYCVVVWAAMIVMWVVVTARNLVHGALPAPPALVRFLADWTWVIVAVLLIAAAASVFFRFVGVFLG